MCERASFDGKTHPGCQTRYSLDGLTSFFSFEGPTKDVIHRLKYRPWIADLVKVLNIPQVNKEEFRGFILIPVPLHPRRERERGFNQASLIAQAIASELTLEFREGILKRTRNTKPQMELKGKERRENIKDAFSVSPNYPLNAIRYTLLIDDVWTTGSTLRACANVLKRAGAKKVWAMTLAR